MRVYVDKSGRTTVGSSRREALLASREGKMLGRREPRRRDCVARQAGLSEDGTAVRSPPGQRSLARQTGAGQESSGKT